MIISSNCVCWVSLIVLQIHLHYLWNKIKKRCFIFIFFFTSSTLIFIHQVFFLFFIQISFILFVFCLVISKIFSWQKQKFIVLKVIILSGEFWFYCLNFLNWLIFNLFKFFLLSLLNGCTIHLFSTLSSFCFNILSVKYIFENVNNSGFRRTFHIFLPIFFFF